MADLHATKRKYTLEQEDLIRKYYPKDLDLLEKLIPDKTRKAIIQKAGKMGLSKKINDRFTEYEDDILKRYYSGNGAEYIIANFMPNRSIDEIHRRTSKLGLKFINYNKDYFEKIDSHEKAYWLGFIYTDGYVCKNDNRFGIEIQKSDSEHLQNLLNLMDSNIKIKYRNRVNRFEDKTKDILESCSICFNNKKLHDDLIDKGVYPNKSLIIRLPEEKILSREYFYDFLRGLIDGDGSISLYDTSNGYKKPSISLVSGSEEFLNDIVNILRLDGIDLKVEKRENIFIIRSEKQNIVFDLLNKIYKNSTNESRLSEKYEKCIEILEYYNVA